jgi:ferric-dicitrate binding protein FerR (iron transport regulator)
MHEPTEGYYWELLAKYLNHEITENEKTELFAWVERRAVNKELFYRSTHLWHLTGSVKTDFQPDVEGAWQKFKGKAQLTPQPQPVLAKPAPQAATGRVIPMYLWRVAAAVLVLVGAAWLATAYLDRGRDVAPVVLTAGNAKKVFLLPDSSRVTLKQFSSLAYAPDLEGAERKVTLQGEGFFEVKRNLRKPFVVLTANARTQVLGTSFTVREDKQSGTTEVQVVTGKVAFTTVGKGRTGKRVVLTPGFKAVAGKTDSLVKSKIEDPNFRAWQTGRLEFDNTRLEQVVASLEDYFGVNIKIQNRKLLDCRFTGSFEQPQLKDVLEVLAVSMQVRYNYEQQHYTFSGRGCQ